MSLDGKRVLVFGGSRNIGYYTSARLLAHGATVTFLLRSTSVFDNDDTIKPYVSSGKARLVNGDALQADDVARAWAVAAQGETTSASGVEFVVFTVGGTPTISITQGAVIEPRNLCTQSVLNVLCTMPTAFQVAQPKFIFVSSTGLTKASHANLPILLKPVYSWLLAIPHADKLGLERVVHYCAGKEWHDPEPSSELMNGTEWPQREGLPGQGELKNWVIVRPSFLTDGDCQADNEAKKKEKKPTRTKEAYKIVEEDEGAGYTISRRDVGHFLAEQVVMNWDSWQGKIVGISY